MTIHLLRPAAGCDSLYTLSQRQRRFRAPMEKGGRPTPIISTKRKPARDDQLLKGGSVYWIIKRAIQARQSIIGIDMIDDPNGGTRCLIYLDEELMRTEPYPQKPFQGWRYLETSNAPPDLGLYVPGDAEEDDVSPEMLAALKETGLI